MAETITCPEGPRITCAILEVADSINADPSLLDIFALVVFPCLTAFGTLAAVFVSLGVAMRAHKSETGRIENEREIRVKRALGSFIEELPGHIEATQRHGRAMMEYMALGKQPGTGSVLPPLRPSTAGLTARLAAAELDASSAEADLIKQLRRVVQWTSSDNQEVREYRLERLPGLIVEWSRGSKDWRLQVIETLDFLAKVSKVDDARGLMQSHRDLREADQVKT